MTETWNRLPGELMESLSLKTFKTYLETTLGNVYSRGPCLSSEVGLDGLQRSLTARTVL